MGAVIMKLPRTVACQLLTIKQPRWRDRVVLLAKYKVGTHNKIVFSDTPSMPGAYYVSGTTAAGYPLESNGKIQCYAVPLDDLEVLE